MPLPQAAADQYRLQQRIALAALRGTRRLWLRMGSDLDGTWSAIASPMSALVSQGQLTAAVAGSDYVGAALREQRITATPIATVRPAAFAGIANDGRPLDSLLRQATGVSSRAIAAGLPVAEGLARGGRWLDMVVSTLIADSGRGATGVGIAVRPSVGYRRMVNPPCCSRCAILAGKFFRWNTGFQRHPRCDCRHIPTAEDRPGSIGTDPGKLFASGQVTGLNRAEAQAIRDGADPAQVVNARRGMTSTSIGGRTVSITTEGSTRRDIPRIRLMPAEIYRVAPSRDEALRLLTLHGYIAT